MILGEMVPKFKFYSKWSHEHVYHLRKRCNANIKGYSSYFENFDHKIQNIQSFTLLERVIPKEMFS